MLFSPSSTLRLFMALLGLIAGTSAFTQKPHLNFEHLTAGDGLSNGTLEKLMQDSRGFLWFATRSGLDRYDGRRFKTYPFNQDPQKSLMYGSSLQDMTEDSLGYFWIQTMEGYLQRFDPRTDLFEHVDLSHLGSDDFINLGGRRLTATAQYVYSLYGTGLIRLNVHTLDVESLPQDDDRPGTLPSGAIIGMEQGPNGTIWVNTRNKLAYSSDGERWHIIPGEGEPVPDGAFQSRLIAGRDEVIVLMEGHRIARYDLEKEKWSVLLEPEGKNDLLSSGVNVLFKDSTGRLWVGTNHGLILLRPDGSSFPYTHNPIRKKSLSGNVIQWIIEDDRGAIWIGTEGTGINILDPYRTPFRWFRQNPFDANGLSSSHVTSAIEMGDSLLWMATWGGGVNLMDRRTGKFSHFDRQTHEDIFTTDLSSFTYLRSTGEILLTVVESPNIAYRIRPGARALEKVVEPALSASSAFRHALHFTDSQGRKYYYLYKGQGQGLLFIDPEREKPILFPRGPEDPPQLAEYRIYGIAETSGGRIWISSFGGGLHLFDPEALSFTSFFPDPDDPRSISHVNTGEVAEDRDGNIWVGSLGKGVDLITREALESDSIHFMHLNEANAGLDGLWETGIQEDDNGNIWICTQQNLHRQIPGTLTFEEVKLDEDFTGFNWWGFQKGESGKFYVGTSNGLFVFHPDSLGTNPVPPPVYITDFRLDNHSVPVRGTPWDTLPGGSPLPMSTLFAPDLELRYGQNDFSFEFAALNYTLPENNRFQYRLEPLEMEWIEPEDELPSARYTNIPAGHYTFRVRAANNDGYWNEEGVSMRLTIHPPWWQSAWAYILYILAILSLLTGLYRYQRRRWQLQANLQLEQEKARRLQELDQFKSRFYTNFTHEFRTPLTVIGGMAEQMPGPERHKSLIRRNVDRLLGIVNQLLDLSRLENDRMRIDWTQADVIPILKYLTESFHSQCGQQGINLAFFSREAELYMDIDPNKLQQILVNLLSNAIKFTPKLGTVKVSAVRVEEDGAPWLELAVADTGKGIPEDQLPHIFDRFYQVDDSTTRPGEGSGIGLALVKELVHLLEGRIEVESEPGKGSTFRVFLPIHRRAERGEPDVGLTPADEAVVTATLKGEGISSAASPNGEKPLVLVVEDNADVAEYIVTCLRTDYEMLTATHGREGLERALDSVPDVILSDVMMPEMDGYELCRALKADRRTSHIPVVMLTAKAAQEDKLAGLAHGADAYLIKPFDKEELRLRLQNLLAQSQRLREHLAHPAAMAEGLGVLEKQEAAFLEELNGILDKNLCDEQFDTHRLCRAIGMSRAQLHRKLKALTGLPTATYMRSYRLRRAKTLLETTDMPVGDVATQVGFKGFSHFSRCFAQEFGILPSETRK